MPSLVHCIMFISLVNCSASKYTNAVKEATYLAYAHIFGIATDSDADEQKACKR